MYFVRGLYCPVRKYIDNITIVDVDNNMRLSILYSEFLRSIKEARKKDIDIVSISKEINRNLRKK